MKFVGGKLFLKVLSTSLYLGCCISQAATPIFIINTANPLFQPQYQLIAYSGNGTLQVPASSMTTTTTAVTLEVGPCYKGYGVPNSWTAPKTYTVICLQTKGSSTKPFYYLGFSTRSLIGNGYIEASLNSSNQFSIAISGGVPLIDQANQQDTIQIGLADMTEMCQRYGAYTSFGTMNDLYNCGGGGLTEPSTTGFPVIAFPRVTLWDHGPLPWSNPTVLYNQKINTLVAGWQYSYNSAYATTLNSMMMIPMCISVQSMLNAQDLTHNYFNCLGSYSTINDAVCYFGGDPSNVSYYGSNAYGVSFLPLFNAFSCDTSAASVNVPNFNVVKKPVAQFSSFYNWFTSTIGLEIINRKTPLTGEMSFSAVGMNNVSPTQPFSSAYKSMLTSMYTTLGTTTPNLSNFVLPTATTTLPTLTQVFSQGIIAVPLFIADPGLSANLTSQNSVNSITETTTQGSPYEYPGMALWQWTLQSGQWVIADGSQQKISYGEGPKNDYEGLTMTDYNPQKSMMSDFYNILSF